MYTFFIPTIYTLATFSDYFQVSIKTALKKYCIIESDKSVIRHIKEVLQNTQDFLFTGYTSCNDQSMELILNTKPDLVFINIDGVLDDAFKFIMELNLYNIPMPNFIALSGTKELAYQAIKSNFFDYLCFPITPIEIQKSMLRLQKQNSYKRDLICLKSYKDYHFLKTNDILFLKADNNTTDFHLVNGSIISAFKTLKTYESKLPSHFKRIHKSYIVNSQMIARIDFGKAHCMLDNFKGPIPFSKKFNDVIFTIYNGLCQVSY